VIAPTARGNGSGVDRTAPLPTTPGPLTPRERQVLQLIANGYLTQQIATFLDISPRTVAVHRSSILVRLRARNITHAAVLAMRNGLVS
jgi:DNA-binding NarL/FixJ family response regulator